MKFNNLLLSNDSKELIEGIIAPAWHLYDKALKGAFTEENMNTGEKVSCMREFSATWVSGIAYELLGISLSEKISNPVVHLSPEDAINVYLAEKESFSIFEARKIEEEDKKILLRDEIKKIAKHIFYGDNSLISDEDIKIHNSNFGRPILETTEPYGVEKIKKELIG